jgi:hypothetical protein
MANPIPFACDMTALSIEQRARHQYLEDRLLTQLRAVKELPHGYAFEFPLNTATYEALTELTPLEHACCPFFNIAIRLESEERLLWQLSGAEGIKPFIRAEFAHWFQ